MQHGRSKDMQSLLQPGIQNPAILVIVIGRRPSGRTKPGSSPAGGAKLENRPPLIGQDFDLLTAIQTSKLCTKVDSCPGSAKVEVDLITFMFSISMISPALAWKVSFIYGSSLCLCHSRCC